MPRDAGGVVQHRSKENELTIAEYVSPGDTVLEIGAHHGFMTTLLAHRVGDAGRVVAIEPMAENVRIIKENVRLNDLANVEVVQAAVGDADGTVKLIERTNSFVEPQRRMSLRRLVNEAVYEKREVDSIRVDTFCQARGLRPDLLKIDVEGYEVAVLRGAEETLAARPKLIVEVHPAQIASFGHHVSEIAQRIDAAAYGIQLLDGADHITPVDSLTNDHLARRIHIFSRPLAACGA